MASLVLGAFNLIQSNGAARVLAEGTSWGAPVPIEIAINSFLQDGAVVVTQGHDNREVNVRVRFYGDNLAALAVQEAALFGELEKPNTLTWTPDGGQPASVFVVVTSSLLQNDESMVGEVQSKPWRTYSVRLLCEAFTRSVSPFTSVGVAPGGATTTTLDTCGATTGWTATVDGVAGTVTSAAGPPTTIAVSSAAVIGSHTLTLQKTFAATTSTTNLLVVDWLPVPAVGASLTATGDGTNLPLFAEAASPTSGYTRTWFKVAAASLAVTKFTMASTGSDLTSPDASAARTLRIDNVAVTDVQPVTGTNRQQYRSLIVPGSARTRGSLAIESATAALGDGTLVYVYPKDGSTTGYSPSLRQFRLSGNTVTTDAALVSGASEPLNGSPVIFSVPIGLFPRGSYLLVGRLATSGGGTPFVGYQYATRFGGTFIDASPALGRTITTTTAYQTSAIARLQLPSVDLDPAAQSAGAVMYLAVQTTVGAATYDEFWLFNTTIGQLTWVDCGTGAGAVGGSSRRLYLEPATVTTPRPLVRVGHSADRSDSHYPVSLVGGVTVSNVRSWQSPEFKPSQVNVLAVTPNATDAVITLGGYAHWHTNPAS
jgi:hypothetical protein